MTKETKRNIANLIISSGATILTAVLLFFGVFDRMEWASTDFRFRYRGPEPPDPNVVIVAIDDQSQQELGMNWPFPRSYHAQLIRNLAMAGAKVIAFDVEFFDEMEEDSVFAEALREAGNVILAKKMKRARDNIWALPAPLLRRSGCALADVDMMNDADSFVRRTRLVEDEPSEYDQFLAAKAVSMFAGWPPARLSEDRQSVVLGPIEVPIDRRGSMLINYSGPSGIGVYPGYSYSYSQILDAETDWGIKLLARRGMLKDKIALIGATYEEAHDSYPTPFYMGTALLSSKEKRLTPGVEIHANIIGTLLQKKFITHVVGWETVLLIWIWALFAGVLMIRFRPLGGLLCIAGMIGVYVVGAVYLFVGKRVWIDIMAPSNGIFLTYVGTVVYRFMSERKEKAMIRGAFAHYVPRAVVGELLQHPEMLTLGGEEREMTVLFSDVEGFTTISEGLAPMALRSVLDEYLTPMTDIILRHQGIIDKYEGDAIMAEFGAPIPMEDHAKRACFAALEMQETLVQLRAQWKQEGKPLLKARIGLGTGLMVIGNMGSQDIFDYTVIGDSVNSASRLEGANKEYSTYLMISEPTYEAAKEHILARELDLIQVKGKSEPVRGYELMARAEDGLPEDKERMIQYFLQGLEAYKGRRWAEALEHFRAALKIVPDDGPSATYVRRCEEFLLHPPPEDWDGVYVMTTK